MSKNKDMALRLNASEAEQIEYIAKAEQRKAIDLQWYAIFDYTHAIFEQTEEADQPGLYDF